MFDIDLTELSTKERTGGNLLVAEVVATAGLVALIFALARTGRGALAAPAVGAYIGAAYWFTSSTSFVNPAVTRPDVLQHVRRHRPVVGARVHRGTDRGRGRRRRSRSLSLPGRGQRGGSRRRAPRHSIPGAEHGSHTPAQNRSYKSLR